jgi:hypothetical protein
MRLMLSALSLAVAIGFSASVPARASTSFWSAFQCRHAEILCLRKLGTNYEKCGTLSGIGGAPQEFPLCAATDRSACVPCWFGSVEETSRRCQAEYGSDCSHFTEQNSNWKGDWDDLDWPDLTPLYRLFDRGPD